jgi:hypothetical protein
VFGDGVGSGALKKHLINEPDYDGFFLVDYKSAFLAAVIAEETAVWDAYLAV